MIEISEDLEELDLDENVIGHVCGGILLDALKARKESKSNRKNHFVLINVLLFTDKLKKICINVSEKIDQYVFADILKLSAKLKKKRKRAKKKVRHTIDLYSNTDMFRLFSEIIDCVHTEIYFYELRSTHM